jgi:hypothetical protein
MIRQLSLLVGSTALAATLSVTAMAQEYSDGGKGRSGRGPAILTPVESYGVHPPGYTGPTGLLHHKNATFVPYYAPLSPTPTFTRYRTTAYTNYYTGYCRHGKSGSKPTPYGADGWGCGPLPAADGPSPEASRYGPFTSVLRDDTYYWRMGGNGHVPYGTPRPPHGGPPDLVDMIQASRNQGGSFGHSSCCAPAAASSVAAGPAIMPPAEQSLSPQ